MDLNDCSRTPRQDMPGRAANAASCKTSTMKLAVQTPPSSIPTTLTISRSLLALACASALHTGARAQPAAAAASLPAEIEACALRRIDAERLACYDKAMATRVRGAPAGHAASAAANPAVPAAAAAAALPAPDSFLDELWELSADRKRGTFNFNGYRPNYFLPVHASSAINRSPATPAAGHSGNLPDYRSLESKLQLSVRTKLAQDVGLRGGDLWFGYTQQSLWQLYSGDLSRPFRATDHEPEIFYIVPTPLDLPLNWKLKMLGLGIAHQSNGQALPFSRSWNRTYALAGLENGEFALTARVNKRIEESDGNDDNPDLLNYRGRTELLGIWSPSVYTLTAQWRTNFKSKRGSLQLDWSMPFNRKDPKGLRWYAQVFSGYGETLIDYNFKQSSVGLGVTLFGW